MKSPLTRYRKLLPFAIIAMAVVVMLLLAQMRASPPQRSTPPRLPVVEVVVVDLASAEFEIRAQGSVQPRTQTTLVSEVTGTVLEVAPSFVAGGFFKRGDLLLRVDPRDYEVAVVRAQANLASRQAQLDQESARAQQAAKDWASLGRAGSPNPLVLRTPYVAEAEANVRAAQADLSSARITLDRTRIRAPFDGLLREKRADVGQFVNVGGALGVLAAVDVAEIRLPITESDLAMVPLPEAGAATPIRLTSRASAEPTQWDAELVRSEGVFDERTRVAYVVAQLRDPYALAAGSGTVPLKFGSFVEARLPANIDRPVISVPRNALRGMDQLLLVDDQDRLRIRAVEVLRTDQDRIYVGSGLVAGERVVMTVMEAPVDGMPVWVIGDADPQPAQGPVDPTTSDQNAVIDPS